MCYLCNLPLDDHCLCHNKTIACPRFKGEVACGPHVPGHEHPLIDLEPEPPEDHGG